MPVQINGEDQGGTGSAGITDITYADLATAIGGSTLKPGAQYRITDFATIHYIVDSAGTRYFEKIAQVDTVTLTGTSGTASITGAGGLTKTVTFATGGTMDLTQTAADFVTSFAADYAATGKDITVTSSSADIIFTAEVAGTGFVHPAIANVTGNLDGTSTITTMNDDPIIIGATEPLIVTALAVNKISHEAKSESYPQDIIHYDWNPDNWLDDLSFADADDTGLVIIDEFKGVITFRHDTLLDNYVGCDFRNCKSRRWKTNVAAWTTAEYAVVGTYVTSGTKIYRSIAATTNNVPPNNTFWVEQLDLALTEYWNVDSTGPTGISSGIEFADFKTFVEGAGSATYELCCRSNHFEGFKDGYTYLDLFGTLLSNNVFFLQDEDYFTVRSNSIGAESAYNTIGNIFKYNTIRINFYQNIIGSGFGYNIIGTSFYNNIIGTDFIYNTIGSGSFNNTIGNSFARNTIGPGFNLNLIGSFFNDNTIGTNFYKNTIKTNFRMNQVSDYFYDTYSFTDATHVYAAYSCTLFTDIDANKKLSYVHDAAFVIVNANA